MDRSRRKLNSMLRKAALVMVLALPPVAASAQNAPLWGGAVAGMTPAEVATLFPTAHRPAYPIELFTLDTTTLTWETSSEEALRACDLRFADAPVCASFYFEKGRLFGVILTSVSPPADVVTSGVLADKFRAAVASRFADMPKCDVFKPSIVAGPSSYCTWWAGNLRGRVDYSFGDPSPINRKRASLMASFMMTKHAAPS